MVTCYAFAAPGVWCTALAAPGVWCTALAAPGVWCTALAAQSNVLHHVYSEGGRDKSEYFANIYETPEISSN